MIPSKFILPFIVLGLLGATSFFAAKYALESSEKSGTIKEQEKTISLLKTNVDSLIRVIESSKENANQIHINIDKAKLKGSGNLIIDSKQLMSLQCDTVGIISWYNSLSRKEKRRF